MKNVYFAHINLGPHCHKHSILIGKQKGWIDVEILDQLDYCFFSDDSFSIKSSIQLGKGHPENRQHNLSRSSELHMLGLEELVNE